MKILVKIRAEIRDGSYNWDIIGQDLLVALKQLQDTSVANELAQSPGVSILIEEVKDHPVSRPIRRDEPQGRWVGRWGSKPVSAKTYHLYRDCGLLGDETTVLKDEISNREDQRRHVEVDDNVIDLLGLKVCSSCHKRSEEVSALDVIGDTLLLLDGKEHSTDTEADAIITALTRHGYVIRRERKGGPR